MYIVLYEAQPRQWLRDNPDIADYVRRSIQEVVSIIPRRNKDRVQNPVFVAEYGRECYIVRMYVQGIGQRAIYYALDEQEVAVVVRIVGRDQNPYRDGG